MQYSCMLVILSQNIHCGCMVFISTDTWLLSCGHRLQYDILYRLVLNCQAACTMVVKLEALIVGEVKIKIDLCDKATIRPNQNWDSKHLGDNQLITHSGIIIYSAIIP